MRCIVSPRRLSYLSFLAIGKRHQRVEISDSRFKQECHPVFKFQKTISLPKRKLSESEVILLRPPVRLIVFCQVGTTANKVGRNALVTSLIVCCGFVVCWSCAEIHFFLSFVGYTADFGGWFYHFTSVLDSIKLESFLQFLFLCLIFVRFCHLITTRAFASSALDFRQDLFSYQQLTTAVFIGG